jgi:tetratricopeptide (TPR) repeat protein
MVNHKISAPSFPDTIVQRERLFRVLENSTDKPAAWISGPGGSGKTTLVSSYLETRKLPALWYQVDQRDTDPATFFYYMGLAFRECVHPDQQPLPLLTPEYLTGIRTFTRRYFEQLFRQLPVPHAIVLDNYQDVSPSAPFHEIILEALSLVPDGIVVIILSRNEPPPVLTTSDAANRFIFLGWNDIRFSFDEARQFAGVQTESPLKTEALSRLYAKTDGWIAGLSLILESIKGSIIDYQLLESLPLDRVFTYFAEKIFDRSDLELQDFLLKTAFVPGVTAQMAQELTGIGSSEQILSRLCRNRFFTEMHSSVTPVYQYHPLFRDFLLSRAENTFSSAETREIRRRSASLLESAGRTEDAAGLLIEAADWCDLTALILLAAPILLSAGRSAAVQAWLECFPEEIVAQNPGLLYWKGICLLLYSPLQSRALFHRSFELYSQAEDRVGMLFAWSGGAGVSLYDGEFTPLDQWLLLLEGMQLDNGPYISQNMEEQMAMSIFNAMAFRQPQHPDISRWRDRAAPLVRGSADINFRLQSAVHLLVHDLWSGNYGRATFMLELILGMARSQTISPMTDITIMNARVLYAFFTGAWESGITLALDALQVADETGVDVWDCQLLGNGASCALSWGDSAMADDLLKRMESRLAGGGKRIDLGQYHGLRGWQESLRKEFTATFRHFTPALESFHAIGFQGPEVVILNGMAENHRQRGDVEQAEAYLSQAYAIACGMGSSYLEFLCLLNSAHLALDRSDDLHADGLLRKALALGRAGGYVNSWFWQPTSLLRLCIVALENNIEVEYVRGLIRRWSLVPETPPLHLDMWPWPFKIKTIGTFELLRDDVPVFFSGKVKKPLELLKTLVASGGKNVSQETLADALWPEADGDQALRSFDTTLHRLRKLMGNENVLQLQAGRLSLDPKYCWIDTWALEQKQGFPANCKPSVSSSPLL